MINPQIGEQMADFACGTGGFITSWLRDVLDYTDDDKFDVILPDGFLFGTDNAKINLKKEKGTHN